MWFVACVGCISVLALRQKGFNWWLIFSLSGFSAMLIFLVISLYLFALFRSVGKTQQIGIEHLLTATDYYMAFYVSTPFLGALAGFLGMIGTNTVTQFCIGICLGTIGATFSVWVVLDPLVGLGEMAIPESRRHRSVRLAMAATEQKKRQEKREQLLAVVLLKEQTDRSRWRKVLRPHAERLAALLETGISDFEQAERLAIDIGANAWQIGGLDCMRELRNMAMAISKESKNDREVIDYISFWWDGIGTWRKPPLE
jgi:hypothetical protein